MFQTHAQVSVLRLHLIWVQAKGKTFSVSALPKRQRKSVEFPDYSFGSTCTAAAPLLPQSPGFKVEASRFWNKFTCNQSREKGNWRG